MGLRWPRQQRLIPPHTRGLTRRQNHSGNPHWFSRWCPTPRGFRRVGPVLLLGRFASFCRASVSLIACFHSSECGSSPCSANSRYVFTLDSYSPSSITDK